MGEVENQGLKFLNFNMEGYMQGLKCFFWLGKFDKAIFKLQEQIFF